MTSLPRRASAGMLRYLPRGNARITRSARAAASVAVVAIAPGVRTSVLRAIFAGSPDPATSTGYPAASASRASTVPTFPAPRIPITRSSATSTGSARQDVADHRHHLAAVELDGP